MDYMKNTVYLFAPFVLGKRDDFNAIVTSLNQSDSWRLVHDDILYMFKYVSDKLDSSNRACQCFHYQLSDEARLRFGLATETDWFSTIAHKFHGREDPIRLQLLSVQLYCFKTSVGIIAFRIHLEKDDPFWVANAEYHLKKVSREQLFLDGCAHSATMLELSERIVEDLNGISCIKFFDFANPTRERSNILTYLEVEPQESYQKELYFLSRCYSDGFLFPQHGNHGSESVFIPSEDTVWGISTEACVCLVCPELGKKAFIRGTFFENFNAQYLFMYVLLLHQKYVLYMLLTRIGIGVYNSLETLEEYRRQLYEFETDFVFSCVSEVPQYQELYDRILQAFSLKKMYGDVREPLISLREVRQEAAKNEQKKRDGNVNRALLMLSVLSFFSALVDSYDFVDSFFGLFMGEIGVRIVQCCCILAIFVVGIFVFKSILDAKK